MSTFLNDVNPDLQDTLAHFGVKGMKWGVKRQQRKEKNQQIRDARQRIANKEAEIINLDRQANKASSTKERARLDKLSTKKAVDLFNSPDHATAARMTSGEKWVNGIMLGTTVAIVGAFGAAQHL